MALRVPADMIGGILIGVLVLMLACYVADKIHPEPTIIERVLGSVLK